MVIPKCLIFYYGKEVGVLGMVEIKFLEVKLQNFAKSAANVLPVC